MIEGIVTSLEILGISQGMGNRGSKSDSLISVKEQRVDGSSKYIQKILCKVYSKCQGNLVFIHPMIGVNTNKMYFVPWGPRPYFYPSLPPSRFLFIFIT